MHPECRLRWWLTPRLPKVSVSSFSPSTSSTRWSPPHDDQQGSLPSCSSTTFCHLSSWRRPTASTTSTSSTTSEQSYGLLMMILILVSDDDDKCDNDDNDGENDNVNATHQVRRCRHHCQLPPHRNHPCLDTGFHNSLFNNFTTFIWSWWRFSQFYIQFFLWCDIFGLGSGFRRQFTVLLILTHLVLGPISSRRLPPAMFLIDCSIHNSFDVSNNKLFVAFRGFQNF